MRGVLIGLMALILGLGMSGCAIKQDDTVVEKAGKHVANTPIYIGGAATAVMSFAGAMIGAPIKGIAEGFEGIHMTKDQNITKKDLDNNPSLEYLAKSGDIYFYSIKDADREDFAVFFSCDKNTDNGTMLAGDWEVVKRVLDDIDKKECDIRYKIDNIVFPRGIYEDSFYDSLEKDSFGRDVWAGNDLVLNIDYLENCRLNTTKRSSCKVVNYIKDARSSDSGNSLKKYMAGITNDSLINDYDLVAEIEESELNSNEDYTQLLVSKDFGIYKKGGDKGNIFYVLDKRGEKDLLVKMDNEDLFDLSGKINSEKVYDWFEFYYCRSNIIDNKKIEEKLLRNNPEYFYNGAILLKIKSMGLFSDKYKYYYLMKKGEHLDLCPEASKDFPIDDS